jgi:PEP-CTERM motif
VRVRTLIAMAVALGLTASANASTIVPGTSDPWLAGMPDGSTASVLDTAPAQSPVQVLLAFLPGDVLTFSATGSTDHCDFGGCGLAGPEGDAGEGPTGHGAGAENGIGDLIAPIDSLVGVFLGPAQPDLSPAPGATLNFSTLASRDFASLSPLLKQPFFIGDGLRNNGLTVQQFIVPVGATRLYLGTMDGFGWLNNVGELTVDVNATSVPEPATIVLVGAGLFGAVRRRVRRR